MRAVRVPRFGGPEVVEVQDVPVPSPGQNEVLVRVAAAGVAPWDAIIREGKSKVSGSAPLTLGSDLAGVVDRVGDGVKNIPTPGIRVGDAVYGVTNPQFVGAQAEYAVCQAGMIAPKPQGLSDLEAGSAPVIAVTAWQMLFEYANSKPGETVLIVGAAGNVGAYAVEMAVSSGIRVVAIARKKDEELLRELGAGVIVDSEAPEFERGLPRVDAILDLVGGETVQKCVAALKENGKLISVVSAEIETQREDVKPVFFYAEVTTARLRKITEMFEAGKIRARVGSVVSLEEALRAYEMLAGAPHEPGKIMLRVR
ncbi:MAG TPA: NADP-dependent oxidoreductase [Acidobacteriaceae bacterium]|nr:NADP-dependent oxidoreductase [Acidobacteriaceae bacterium]